MSIQSQLIIEPMNSMESLDSPSMLMEEKYLSRKQLIAVDHIQKRIFEATNNDKKYSKKYIKISEGQVLTTYLIQGNSSKDQTFYIGHGFGGSSLMFFPIFNMLLQKGNILLWQIRGMGIGPKKSYGEIDDNKINDFYLEGLQKIIDYYDHKRIIFICHSLSAYIVLRYLSNNPSLNNISKCIMLSPVGLTEKNEDSKNQINSCSDCFDALLNSFGWKFRLTFKSPLRYVCCCLKRNILRKAFSDFSLTQQYQNLLADLFQTLTILPDGSQDIFFRYFHPRVLPREEESICQIVKKGHSIPYKVSIYYGGQSDWVDRKGAKYLCSVNPNFKLVQLSRGGHMFCLIQQVMRQVIENEIN